MNKIVQNLFQFLDAVVKETSRFDETTWAVLSVTTVVFGYFLLRGNVIR